jgi:serine/threonine protein kinase
VEGAPNTTVSNRPVLVKYPRGYAPGDKVFPLISDYVALVDVLQAVHEKGWLHNDVAPSNIFFRITNGPPEVFLNDFGSATKGLQSNANPKSRALFYHCNASSAGFEFGSAADLRALILSIFVLTQRDAFDRVQVTTATELEKVARQAQPWSDALSAAKELNYETVKITLNSTKAQ